MPRTLEQTINSYLSLLSSEKQGTIRPHTRFAHPVYYLCLLQATKTFYESSSLDVFVKELLALNPAISQALLVALTVATDLDRKHFSEFEPSLYVVLPRTKNVPVFLRIKQLLQPETQTIVSEYIYPNRNMGDGQLFLQPRNLKTPLNKLTRQQVRRFLHSGAQLTALAYSNGCPTPERTDLGPNPERIAEYARENLVYSILKNYAQKYNPLLFTDLTSGPDEADTNMQTHRVSMSYLKGTAYGLARELDYKFIQTCIPFLTTEKGWLRLLTTLELIVKDPTLTTMSQLPEAFQEKLAIAEQLEKLEQSGELDELARQKKLYLLR